MDIGVRFAQSLGLIGSPPINGDVGEVEVTLVREAKPATLVVVEPASEDDWEVVVSLSVAAMKDLLSPERRKLT
jgi:hypothetical protein